MTRREQDVWNGHYRKDGADGIAARKHLKAAFQAMEQIFFYSSRPHSVDELETYAWCHDLVADRMKRAAAAIRRVKRRHARMVKMGLLRA